MQSSGKTEILVLKKLDGRGIEVPGGTVEENESPEDAESQGHYQSPEPFGTLWAINIRPCHYFHTWL